MVKYHTLVFHCIHFWYGSKISWPRGSCSIIYIFPAFTDLLGLLLHLRIFRSWKWEWGPWTTVQSFFCIHRASASSLHPRGVWNSVLLCSHMSHPPSVHIFPMFWHRIWFKFHPVPQKALHILKPINHLNESQKQGVYAQLITFLRENMYFRNGIVQMLSV